MRPPGLNWREEERIDFWGLRWQPFFYKKYRPWRPTQVNPRAVKESSASSPEDKSGAEAENFYNIVSRPVWVLTADHQIWCFSTEIPCSTPLVNSLYNHLELVSINLLLTILWYLYIIYLPSNTSRSRKVLPSARVWRVLLIRAVTPQTLTISIVKAESAMVRLLRSLLLV